MPVKILPKPKLQDDTSLTSRQDLLRPASDMEVEARNTHSEVPQKRRSPESPKINTPQRPSKRVKAVQLSAEEYIEVVDPNAIDISSLRTVKLRTPPLVFERPKKPRTAIVKLLSKAREVDLSFDFKPPTVELFSLDVVQALELLKQFKDTGNMVQMLQNHASALQADFGAYEAFVASATLAGHSDQISAWPHRYEAALVTALVFHVHTIYVVPAQRRTLATNENIKIASAWLTNPKPLPDGTNLDSNAAMYAAFARHAANLDAEASLETMERRIHAKKTGVLIGKTVGNLIRSEFERSIGYERLGAYKDVGGVFGSHS